MGLFMSTKKLDEITDADLPVTERCYLEGIPEHCAGVDWFETLPAECVSCVDARFTNFFYGLRHNKDSMFAKQSILRVIDEKVPLPVIAFIPIVLFFLFHSLQAANLMYSGTTSFLSTGGGFLFRYILGIAFGYMLLNVISMYYYSHRPNLTEDTVNTYDRLLPASTEMESYLSSRWGRIEGWKSENSSFYDQLLLIMKIAFFTLWFQVFASGTPLSGNNFVVFFGILLLIIMFIFFERVAGMGTMWLSDSIILGGVAIVSATVSLGFYTALYKAVVHYQSRLSYNML
jgi:hypothetical protein